MKKIIGYFINNPLIVNIMIVSIFIFGLISASKLKRETLPEVDFDILLIQTSYPGAAPLEVELNVSKKIEEELKEVEDLEKFISYSANNVSTVVVWVDMDAKDKDEVKDEIRKAVDRAEAEFPDNVEKPVVSEIKTDDIPIIRFQIASNILSEDELRLITRNLEDDLENMDEVSKVTKQAYRDAEIKVMGDLAKMKSKSISLDDLSTAILQHNVRLGGGSLKSSLKEQNIVTITEFTNLKEIEDVVIRSNFQNMGVRIKDVAEVKNGYEDRKYYARGNQVNGLSISVFKKDRYDIIRTVDKVKARVKIFKNNIWHLYNYKNIIKKDKSFDKAFSELSKISKMNHFSSIAAQHLLNLTHQTLTQITKKDLIIFGFNDITKGTRRLLSISMNNALIGFIMVFLTLLVFLDFKVAFWTAFGIPLAFMLVFISMSFLGFSINNISLFGIITVLGILVDDGIVAAENIHRKKELGLSGPKAGLEGSYEIFYPLLGTVLTTILAFLPLAFLSGIMGKFVFQLPIVIIIALLASLIEVFFALPSHLSHDSAKHRKKEIESRKWFQSLLKSYKWLLERALKMRYLVIFLFIVVLVICFKVIFPTIKFILFSNKETERIIVTLETPSGTSLEETLRRVKKLEAMISKEIPKNGANKEMDSMFSMIGSNKWSSTRGGSDGSHKAFIQIILVPFANRARIADEIIAVLRKKTMPHPSFSKWSKLPYIKESLSQANAPSLSELHQIFKEQQNEKGKANFFGMKNWLKQKYPQEYQQIAKTTDSQKVRLILKKYYKEYQKTVKTDSLLGLGFKKILIEELKGGPPVGAPIELKIISNDDKIRNYFSDKIKQWLLKQPGIFSFEDDRDDTKDEILVKFRFQEMYKYGVNPYAVAKTVRTAFEGNEVSSITHPDEDVEIVVQIKEKYKKDKKYLSGLLIPTKYGKQIELSKVADFPVQRSQDQIRRMDGKRSVTLLSQINYKLNTPQNVMKKLVQIFKPQMDQYPGLKLKVGGEAQAGEDSIKDAKTAFIFAIFGIFIVLLLIFKSLSQPLMVLSVIPFEFIGIIISFKLHGEAFGFFALIGMVGLTGVIVNDSIVMVDFMNRLKKELDEGDHIISKVVEGAAVRLRPIILTTVTTVMGLFPSVYNLGGSNAFLRPLTMAMAYGLLFGTLITLFLIPSLYMIDHDVKTLIKRIKKFLKKLTQFLRKRNA